MANPSDPLTVWRPALPGSRRLPGPSAKPAAIVFSIIAVIFVAGFVTDDLTSAHRPAAAPSTTIAATVVPGTGGLVPEPATSVIGAVVQPDEPPTDILAALVVPKGSAAVPGSASQQGLGLYDATIDLQVPASESDVITFLRKELTAGRWQVDSAGASGTGYRIIAEHPGSDGYEWEVGFTASPSTFSSAVPGSSAPASGVTPVALRLFATDDDS